MPIIKSIREYFKQCPLLEKQKINVNYLGAEPLSYSIEEIPEVQVLKKYTDGGELRQKLFTFSSREVFDSEVISNESISQFYEELAKWVEENNKKGIFPKMEEKFEPWHIEMLTSQYLMQEDGKTARFQMDFKLIYKSER